MMTRFPKAIVSFFQILPLRNAPHFQKALGHTKGNTDNFPSAHISSMSGYVWISHSVPTKMNTVRLFCIRRSPLWPDGSLRLLFYNTPATRCVHCSLLPYAVSFSLLYKSWLSSLLYIVLYQKFFIFCCENNRKNSIVPLYCTHSK